NRIGTDGDGVSDDLERNVLSGNQRGLTIQDVASNYNVIAGNFIGTNATGTAVVANGQDGVIIWGGAQSNRVGTNGDGISDALERNVISGNLARGVRITDSGTNLNVVAGNFIGTDVNGALDFGNSSDGVVIQNAAKNNLIGGDS